MMHLHVDLSLQALTSDTQRLLISKAMRELTLTSVSCCITMVNAGAIGLLAKLAKSDSAEVQICESQAYTAYLVMMKRPKIVPCYDTL